MAEEENKQEEESPLRKEIREYVTKSMSEHMSIPVAEIGLESKLADLGDSLDSVELVMDYEDHFNIKIPDEDADKIKTVKDTIDYIEQRKAA